MRAADARNASDALLDSAHRGKLLARWDRQEREEQERVEEIEREYLRRLENQRDAELPATAVDASAPPLIDQADRIPPSEPSKDTPFDDDSEIVQPLGAQVPASDPGT